MPMLRNRPDFYMCSDCGEKFTNKAKLNHHVTTHMDRDYMCHICKMTFSRKVHLTDHLKTHSGEKPYICYTCDKRFLTLSNLKTHKKVHKKGLKCEFCDKVYPYPYMLKKHMESHFTESYDCQYCNISLSSIQEYNDHVIVHEKQLLTKESNIKTTKRQVLNQVNAINNMNGVEMYKCTICNKTFMLPNYLKNHMEMHNLDSHDKHKCKNCNKTFELMYLLRNHNTQASSHRFYNYFTQKMPYAHIFKKYHQKSMKGKKRCQQVGFHELHHGKIKKRMENSPNTVSKTKRNQGKRIKQFRCLICKKAFSLVSIFRIHKKRHAYENPYSCNKCDETFDQLNKLDLHIKNLNHNICENLKKECLDFSIKKEKPDEILQLTPIKQEITEHFCTISDFLTPQIKEENYEGQKIEKIKAEEERKEEDDESKFTCGTCGEEFKFEYAYKRHELTHTENKPHQCSCGASFMKATLLALHQVTHNHTAAVSTTVSPSPKAKLIFRNVTTPLPNSLISSNVVTNQKNYLSSNRSKTKIDFVAHNILEPDKIVDSNSIPRYGKISSTSKTSYTKKSAYDDVEVDSDREIFEVGKSKSPPKKQTKQLMAEENGKSFECELCGKLFATKRYMVKHRQRHDHLETYKCEKCDKYFVNWYVLETHEKTCSLSKPSCSGDAVKRKTEIVKCKSKEQESEVNVESQSMCETSCQVKVEPVDNFMLNESDQVSMVYQDDETVVKSEIIDW